MPAKRGITALQAHALTPRFRRPCHDFQLFVVSCRLHLAMDQSHLHLHTDVCPDDPGTNLYSNGNPLPRTNLYSISIPYAHSHQSADRIADLQCVSRWHAQVFQGWSRRSVLASNRQSAGLRVFVLIGISLHERCATVFEIVMWGWEM